MIAGPTFTVSVAGMVVTVPTELVNTAWYRLPLSAAVVAKLNVVEVAPGMLLNAPPKLLTCHCTVGVGLPVAAAVKVTTNPAVTVWLDGFVVIEGATPVAVPLRPLLCVA